MADITKVSTASIDPVSARAVPFISGLVAGEDLQKASPCYILGEEVYMSGSSVTETFNIVSGSLIQSRVDGFTAESVLDGEPVTLFGNGARFNYSSGLMSGSPLFVGVSSGSLSYTKSLEGDLPVARVITSTDIIVLK